MKHRAWTVKACNLLSNKKGFTFLELMLALALMGLIITAAVPAFTSFKHINALNSEAHRLASDLKYMRQMALTQGNRYAVTFDADGCAYSISRETESEFVTIKTVVIEHGISVSTEDSTGLTGNAIVFSSEGKVEGPGLSGDIDILLENTGEMQVCVSLEAGGKVDISWR